MSFQIVTAAPRPQLPAPLFKKTGAGSLVRVTPKPQNAAVSPAPVVVVAKKAPVARPTFVSKTLRTGSLTQALAVAEKSKREKLEKQYCMFFNRFGRCNNGDKCTYIHDPSKVAVCTKFLKGLCADADCPFSHKVDKDKMPVCYHFLNSFCKNENCPYSHVKVNSGASVCQDFLKGLIFDGVCWCVCFFFG